MIWFVISIVLLLFSAAVTGIALSNNVRGPASASFRASSDCCC
ncbi:MAG: hypothetical protein ACLR5C_08060 [Bifidobacterium adolescentis]